METFVSVRQVQQIGVLIELASAVGFFDADTARQHHSGFDRCQAERIVVAGRKRRQGGGQVVANVRVAGSHDALEYGARRRRARHVVHIAQGDEQLGPSRYDKGSRAACREGSRSRYRPRLRIVHGDVAFGQLDPFDTVVRGAAHQQHRSIAVHYRRMKRQAGSVMGSPGVRRRVVADKTRSQRPIRLARFAVYVQLAVEHGHRCAAESLG